MNARNRRMTVFCWGDLYIAPIIYPGRQERDVYLPKGKWISLWSAARPGAGKPIAPQAGDCAQTADAEQALHVSAWERVWLTGGKSYRVRCGRDVIPVFLREGGCLVLNLSAGQTQDAAARVACCDQRPKGAAHDDGLDLGSDVGNGVDSYKRLCLCPVGRRGAMRFADGLGNEIRLHWENGHAEAERLGGDEPFEVLTAFLRRDDSR